MYKTILVPLDGSKRAEAILPHVEELAERNGTTVILLQVVEAPRAILLDTVEAGLYWQELDRCTEMARTYLTGVQQRLHGKGIQARIIVVRGRVVEGIIDAAEQGAADLIAMASHGWGGLRRVFYGSVAAGVLHRVDRPLLLVRSEGSE